MDVYEPVPNLQIWLDGKVRLRGCQPNGNALEMSWEEASAVSDLLRELSQPGFPDIPSEPDESGYGALMHVACVVWGFCGCTKNGRPLHVDDFLPSKGPVTADQFTEWLFLADNLNPNVDQDCWKPHKDAIKAAFVRYMGAETVDARQFRYEGTPPEYDPELKWRGPLPDNR